MSLFVQNVTPAFKDLLAAKAAFRERDLSNATVDEITQALDKLKAAEKHVMLMWAKSTTDINPGMIEAVKAGRTTYTLAIERVIGAPEKSLCLADDTMLQSWIETIPHNEVVGLQKAILPMFSSER